jgi:predicted  nucleic acid-binding Zn-ribbon protein
MKSITAMNASTSTENQEAAHLEKLRSQISTDIEVMHQKEASLREYEQRLRVLVDNVQHTHPAQGATPAPAPVNGPSQAELDSQWEKYERAHALLEAARRGLSDDRMALKDREEKVMIREQEVARREAWVKVREEEFAAKVAVQTAAVPAKAKPGFTVAPFLAAKNLLSLGKGH